MKKTTGSHRYLCYIAICSALNLNKVSFLSTLFIHALSRANLPLNQPEIKNTTHVNKKSHFQEAMALLGWIFYNRNSIFLMN
jgi:hypothetical protein